jgi:hypothetical protein
MRHVLVLGCVGETKRRRMKMQWAVCLVALGVWSCESEVHATASDGEPRSGADGASASRGVEEPSGSPSEVDVSDGRRGGEAEEREARPMFALEGANGGDELEGVRVGGTARVFEGGCDASEVVSVMGERASDLRACYERALATDRAVAGEVELELKVSARGVVRSTKVASSGVEAGRLEACAREVYDGVSFGARREGACVARVGLWFSTKESDARRAREKKARVESNKAEGGEEEAPKARSMGPSFHSVGGLGLPPVRVGHGYGVQPKKRAARKTRTHDPVLVFGAPTFEGSCDRGGVREAVAAKSRAFRYCYEKELVGRPDLAGELVVEAVIEGGEVASSKGTSSELGAKVTGCVGRVFKRIPLDGAARGRCEVSYPMSFSSEPRRRE